jgi:hypothetical protein
MIRRASHLMHQDGGWALVLVGQVKTAAIVSPRLRALHVLSFLPPCYASLDLTNEHAHYFMPAQIYGGSKRPRSYVSFR